MNQHPAPAALWEQAQAQHPNDPQGRRERYFALMREHGHLLDKPECDHDSASGIDQTPLNDPSKVWECDSCGWRFVGRTAAMNPAKRCDRCKTEVSWGRDCTRNGEPAFLGGSCGCVERWLQQRELWEFEVTGVVSGIRSNVLRAKP